MFYNSIFLFLSFFIMPLSAFEATNIEKSPLLVVNAYNIPDQLPLNFRTTQDTLAPTAQNVPSIKGLRELKASGSSQFSDYGLEAIIKRLDVKKLVIVDLRGESHGFLNGMAISWYGFRNAANANKTPQEAAATEEQLLQNLSKQYVATIHQILEHSKSGGISKTVSENVLVGVVESEKEITAQYDIDYLRIYVTDRQRPSDANVDQFVSFVRNLPQDTWLHFHCLAGHGRTTTFMVMLDMMRNAKSVSFEDIVQRQYLLGGTNLLKNNASEDWKIFNKDARIAFIKKFYDYAKNNQDNFATSWSKFIEK